MLAQPERCRQGRGRLVTTRVREGIVQIVSGSAKASVFRALLLARYFVPRYSLWTSLRVNWDGRLLGYPPASTSAGAQADSKRSWWKIQRSLSRLAAAVSRTPAPSAPARPHSSAPREFGFLSERIRKLSSS